MSGDSERRYAHYCRIAVHLARFLGFGILAVAQHSYAGSKARKALRDFLGHAAHVTLSRALDVSPVYCTGRCTSHTGCERIETASHFTVADTTLPQNAPRLGAITLSHT